MNVLVIGCGLLGQKVARTLDQMGWQVSALDDRESELQQLGEDFGGVMFRGFPMDLRSLREAGIESCDAVAVTTSDDNLNIAVAQIARDYFGIDNVVARISDPARESVFENFGLRTVCPTNLTGDRIVSAITGETNAPHLKIGMHTVQFSVRPADKFQIGKTLQELRGYPKEMVFGLVRTSGAFLLNAVDSAKPESGDYIVYAKVVD